MVKCECIEKFRDKQGNIKGYRLRDNQGQCLDVKSDQLKMAIFSKQIEVLNLKLTTDGKLIDKEIDVITQLKQIDAYNRTKEAKADRLKKYLMIVKSTNKLIQELNEKYNMRDYRITGFKDINIYEAPLYTDFSELLYNKNTHIKLDEVSNIIYYVHIAFNTGTFYSTDLDEDIDDYLREYSHLQLSIAITSDSEFKKDYMPCSGELNLSDCGTDLFGRMYKYNNDRYYSIYTGNDDIDYNKTLSALLIRVIYAEVLDNYSNIIKLIDDVLTSKYAEHFA